MKIRLIRSKLGVRLLSSRPIEADALFKCRNPLLCESKRWSGEKKRNHETVMKKKKWKQQTDKLLIRWLDECMHICDKRQSDFLLSNMQTNTACDRAACILKAIDRVALASLEFVAVVIVMQQKSMSHLWFVVATRLPFFFFFFEFEKNEMH